MSSLVWKFQGAFVITSDTFGLWLLNTSRKYDGFTFKENVLSICTAEPRNAKDYFSNHLMLVLIGAFGYFYFYKIIVKSFIIFIKIIFRRTNFFSNIKISCYFH